jgi:hypothetical protein
LKKAQLELNKFKIENKELKLLVAEQTSHGGSSRPAKKSQGSKSVKKRRGSGSESEGDIWLDRVALLGRKFGVMNKIFIEPKHFMIVRPDIDTTNRYVSSQSRMAGLTAELFREVPEDLQELLVNDSKFRDEVLREYTFLPVKVLLTSMGHITVHYQAERQSQANCALTPLHFRSNYLWRQ